MKRGPQKANPATAPAKPVVRVGKARIGNVAHTMQKNTVEKRNSFGQPKINPKPAVVQSKLPIKPDRKISDEELALDRLMAKVEQHIKELRITLGKYSEVTSVSSEIGMFPNPAQHSGKQYPSKRLYAIQQGAVQPIIFKPLFLGKSTLHPAKEPQSSTMSVALRQSRIRALNKMMNRM